MRPIILASIVSIAAGMTWASEASARCLVDRFTGNPDTVTVIQMRLVAGERCVVRHMTRRYSRSEQRVFPTSNISLTSRPQHGTASTNGSRVTYVSTKGYAGSDTFSYATHHAPVNGKAARSFRYQVAVTVL